MRIVAGEYRGRNLVPFDGDKIRPTADKVRESLFNILNFKITDSTFLDLFCGTGAIGLEAMSRGAKRVVFNDISLESLNILKKNIEKIKASGNYEIKNFDALTYIKNSYEKFDFIYVDPPYKSERAKSVLDSVSILLNEDGRVIYESETPVDFEVLGLIKTDERKYGRAYLTFFKKVI